MKPARHRSPWLAAVLAALALARLSAADRAPAAPAPLPAENPPAVSLPAPAATPAPDTAVATPAAPPAAGASAPSVAGEKAASEKTKAKTAGKKADKNSATKAAGPPPLSPRFQQVRDRIKALYGNRDEPRSPYDPRQNPFRSQVVAAEPPPVATTTTTTPGQTLPPLAPPPPPPAEDSNLALLKQAVTQIKPSGTYTVQGRVHVSISSNLYKEGDIVKTTVKGQVVLLRITKLSLTSLTFTLNDAEMTIRL